MKFVIKNDFVKSVAVLMTGTVLSQVINYLISPILTRIYTSAEMGDLNLYMRAVSFIVAMATARFEMSLPLPKNDSHSFLLYRISLKIAMGVLLSCGIIGFGYFIFGNTSSFSLLFLFFVLVSTLFSVVINLGTNWSIRKNTFRLISTSRIINSSVSNALRWIFGLLGYGSVGLLLATTLGTILSSFTFIKDYRRNFKLYKSINSPKKIKVLVTEYKEFPLVNLPHTLSDLGRDLLIAFLIVYHFGKDYFGLYSYSLMMLSVPMSLIGQSIGQVFYNKASTLLHQGDSIVPLLLKTMKTLAVISFLPFLILFFWSEDIFGFVFGEDWRLAGYFAEICVIYYYLNFIVSPLANLSMVLNRQKELFYLGLFNSVLQLLIIGILPYWFEKGLNGFSSMLWILVAFQSLMMLVTGMVYLKYATYGRK